MTTIQELLQHGVEQFRDFEQPQLEAEILLAFCLKKPRSYLYAWPEALVTEESMAEFFDYLDQRLAGKPSAYITGMREFWSLSLNVSPHTLIPRPETELLVTTVLAIFPEVYGKLKVADLGTGSGAIALSLASERPNWEIHATDIRVEALQLAIQNAEITNLTRVQFHPGSWCMALPSKKFDVIVSNPPYLSVQEWEQYGPRLKFEPKPALVSGERGLDAIAEIIQTAPHFLSKQGLLMLEHGFAQASAVRELLAIAGFDEIHSLRDLNQIERLSYGKLNKSYC